MLLWYDCDVKVILRHSFPVVFSRESRLCGGKTVFCVLLQHEESEGSVHLSGSGSEGASEGTSKTDI